VGIVRDVQLEKRVLRYIFFDERRNIGVLLRAIVDCMASREMACIRENRCPYCGRRFKTRVALYAHLVVHQARRGSKRNCKPRFAALVSDVLECYRSVKERIHWKETPGVTRTDKYIYYNSMNELAPLIPRLCRGCL